MRADTRLPEVEAELSNITTRLAVISGMKPALEENPVSYTHLDVYKRQRP